MARYLLVTACLLLTVTVATAQAPAPAHCLNDFSYNAVADSDYLTLAGVCPGAGCCNNLQFLAANLMVKNAQSNANIFAITTQSQINQACTGDFYAKLASIGINATAATCQGTNLFFYAEPQINQLGCSNKDPVYIQNAAGLNDVRAQCQASGCNPSSTPGITACQALLNQRAQTIMGPNDTLAACTAVLYARFAELNFDTAYKNILLNCGNTATNNTVLNVLPQLLLPSTPTTVFNTTTNTSVPITNSTANSTQYPTDVSTNSTNNATICYNTTTASLPLTGSSSNSTTFCANITNLLAKLAPAPAPGPVARISAPVSAPVSAPKAAPASAPTATLPTLTPTPTATTVPTAPPSAAPALLAKGLLSVLAVTATTALALAL